MALFSKVLCLVAVCALCACSQRKTTAELGDALVNEVRALPDVISSVHDEPSANAAAESIAEIRLGIRSLLEQVQEGERLNDQELIAVERKLREVHAETEYVLKGLRANPKLLLIVADPLAELGSELELASKVLKGEE